MARRPTPAAAAAPAPELADLSVERAVRDTLANVPATAVVHAALVATALTLARKLDEGAGLATAAVARELRATLDAITQEGEGDDDLHDFVSGLSSPLGHPAFS